ncbi:MAG TPA: DUF559 domain-containing protein [Bacilli bacterium]
MEFAEAHAAFIRHHLEKRTGERRGRLERGHQHGEMLFLKNVWWPLRGNFRDLHPEYEVTDWRGRPYFADFAWLPGQLRLVIEIKGYASHVRDMDRQKFCHELNRETFLHAMGFQVISFAYDDIEQRPKLCITLLQMVMSRYLPSHAPISRALLAEKEVVRLAVQMAKPVRPIDLVRHFEIDQKTAILLLKKLCRKGWLQPIVHGGGKRIARYELTRGAFDYID